jgi:ribosomal protein L13E
MRTTLDIDDDILLAAKELARKDKVSAGRVLSTLARAGLGQASFEPRQAGRKRATASPLGIAVLPRRDELITNEHVNRLRDELGV